jgi:hypothetical protein
MLFITKYLSIEKNCDIITKLSMSLKTGPWDRLLKTANRAVAFESGKESRCASIIRIAQ